MQQHIGNGWRVLAGVLGLWAVPANAATSGPSKQTSVVYEYLWAKLVEFGWGKLALLYLGMLAVTFLVCWAMARLMAPRYGTFRKTFRYFVVSLLLSIPLVLLSAGIGWYAVRSGAPGGAVVAGIIALIGFIIISFAVPMVIFDIGIFRTLIFNLLVVVGTGVMQTALGMVVPGPFAEIEGKSQEEAQKVIAEWDMQRRQKALEDRLEKLAGTTSTGSASSSADEVQRLYVELQQAREKLDVNDQAAVAAFNTRVSEYNAAKARLVPVSAAPAPGGQ